MTLFASRDKATGHVTVHCTYGTVTFAVTEDPRHAGSFWAQLGELLQDHEKPRLTQDIGLPGDAQEPYGHLGRGDSGIPAE